MNRQHGTYPDGLKPGDFIQLDTHFGDYFSEVQTCSPPSEGSSYWQVTFSTYDKHSCRHDTYRVNSAGCFRRVLPAEMAVPIMRKKHQRFAASFGQYDPFDGFTPAAGSTYLTAEVFSGNDAAHDTEPLDCVDERCTEEAPR